MGSPLNFRFCPCAVEGLDRSTGLGARLRGVAIGAVAADIRPFLIPRIAALFIEVENNKEFSVVLLFRLKILCRC